VSRYAQILIAAAASLAAAALPLPGQRLSIEPVKPAGPGLLRPYQAPAVPPIRQGNSVRLNDLVRAGNLYLTAQDAVALALENNIDLEVARYSPILAAWQLERSLAGGALPGVPSGAAQVGSVAAGQGVTGSQQAAGVSGGGAGGRQAAATNVGITQIGPVTQNLDPSFQHASTFSHTSTPQANVVQSVTSVLINKTRVFNSSLQQGFLTGGSVTLSFRDNYLWENSPTNILNPSSAPNLSLSFQHNLLRGFGIAVNGRTITISRMNLKTTDLSFRMTVENLVTQVLMAYYNLAAAHENLKASTVTLEAAQKLLASVKEQVKVGTMAPPEMVTSATQVANSELAVVNAQTAVKQQELQLKNLLSRTGVGDPLLKSAGVVLLDRITVPAKENLPPVDEMVREALANRTDLAVARANLEASQTSAQGTRNGVLPSLQVFGAMSQAGLAGERSGAADPYFEGGFGTAVGQVFRRNFPTQRIGVFYQGAVHNRQAQADAAIDQLQLRQSELGLHKQLNQVQVDVQNTLFAVEQARVRYEAAVKSRQLQEGLLRAEQERYELGTSTPTNVAQQQRDLATARSAEVAAMVAYANARVSMDRTLGRTLAANRISIAEARDGALARRSSIPAEAPVKP
jgi:outer membrane protein